MYNPPGYLWAMTIAGIIAILAATCVVLYGGAMRADLGLYKILATAGDTSAMERFVGEWLGALIDYDAEHGSPLVLTLSEYLDCGGNYDASAKALSVHRSTLKYRLQRIRDIITRDLSDTEVRLNLDVAVRIWRVHYR